MVEVGRGLEAHPIVSVVMPVRNGEAHVREAVESILAQTFQDFEFIIVDDGSTDGTRAILATYEQADARIRVHCHERRGLAASLNLGCGLAKGKYVARMDADDISLPRRFEKQVWFLDTHPEVGLCGTWGACIDHDGRPLSRLSPKACSAAQVRWNLLFQNVLVHPSVMMRCAVLPCEDPYRTKIEWGEDYDLWIRLMATTQIVNIPEKLILYRLHEHSVSARYTSAERATVEISQRSIAGLLGGEIPSPLVEDLRRVASWNRCLDQEEKIHRVRDLIWRLYLAYNSRLRPTSKERREVAGEAAMLLVKLACLHVWAWPASSRTALWRALLLDPLVLMTFPFKRLERRISYALSGVHLRSRLAS